MSALSSTTVNWLQSLGNLELTRVLSLMPRDRQVLALAALRTAGPKFTSDRDRDAGRKREKRSEASRIYIPGVVNPARRERCLADPVDFLLTYFPKKYTIRFGKHHLKMIDVIISRAKYGGRQAVAAPRGCGKSELVKGLLVYLVLAGLVQFPVVGAATEKLGRRLYNDFRGKIAKNKLLLQDFPEVCYPVRALDGAPQRAGRQHVNGELTGIVWTATDYIRLPDVPGSSYGGVLLSSFGLDAAFRGFNIEGARPDFVLIDDPETRESAKSYDQGVDREDIIDKDIAGLASQEDNLAIVVLTTVQNCYCLSYRITDPTTRAAFNGIRYGMIVKWPTDMDLWTEYISIRHKDQAGGDEHGLNAVKFYRDNREKMDAGAEMLSDHFVSITLDDGTELVHSAIQQAFNKIADTNMESYKTEYQNDPTPDDNEKKTELTAAIVANRISGLGKNELPACEGVRISMGIDLGDHYGHWVKTAWTGNAAGCVIDYGVMEVPGYVKGQSREAKEIAVHKALLEFCPRAAEENPPEFCLIDAGDGDHTQAVYNAVLQLGGSPWAASKGYAEGRFHMPVITAESIQYKRAFEECWAGRDRDKGIWLYHVNTEHWKNWLHNRFLTPTFTQESIDAGQREFADGSLSLFHSDDKKQHHTFSHHMVSEMRQERFVEGKGWVRKWVVKNKFNNHFLDALALACAAAGCLGVRLISRVGVSPQPVQVPARPVRQLMTPHGQPFLITERNR